MTKILGDKPECLPACQCIRNNFPNLWMSRIVWFPTFRQKCQSSSRNEGLSECECSLSNTENISKFIDAII